MRVPPAQRFGRPFSSVQTLFAPVAHDFVADAGHEFLQAPLVLMEVKSHSRQRQAPTVALAWIEIDAIVTMRQSFRLHVEVHSSRIVAAEIF